MSLLAYLAAIGIAFPAALASTLIYVGVAITWLGPDRQLESLATNA
jgi:hypothetical protein